MFFARALTLSIGQGPCAFLKIANPAFMKKSIILLALFFSINAAAQPVILKKVMQFLDTMCVNGLDHRYIDAPEKPWQIMVQGNVNQTDLKMESTINGAAMFSDVKGNVWWQSRVRTDVSSYVGLWAGYRGYGLGYSVNVGGDKGSIFKIGATGGAYGVNLRIHKFKTEEPSIKFRYNDIVTNQPVEGGGTFDLLDAMDIKTVTLDAYYLFNRKKFSYCAAYDQSVFQKRSAGSFMVGAMYYNSTISYDQGLNADFILMMDDIGKIKQTQISIGPGYAYNFVPCKGLLISALAMPMVTLYNRLDAWHYNSNLRKAIVADLDNPVPEEEPDITVFDYIIYPSEGVDKITYPEAKDYKVSRHGKVSFTFDARLSLTYNFGDWFVNAYAQLYRFPFKYDNTTGNLHDWFVNACFGIRL